MLRFACRRCARRGPAGKGEGGGDRAQRAQRIALVQHPPHLGRARVVHPHRACGTAACTALTTMRRPGSAACPAWRGCTPPQGPGRACKGCTHTVHELDACILADLQDGLQICQRLHAQSAVGSLASIPAQAHASLWGMVWACSIACRHLMFVAAQHAPTHTVEMGFSSRMCFLAAAAFFTHSRCMPDGSGMYTALTRGSSNTAS